MYLWCHHTSSPFPTQLCSCVAACRLCVPSQRSCACSCYSGKYSMPKHLSQHHVCTAGVPKRWHPLRSNSAPSSICICVCRPSCARVRGLPPWLRRQRWAWRIGRLSETPKCRGCPPTHTSSPRETVRSIQLPASPRMVTGGPCCLDLPQGGCRA